MRTILFFLILLLSPASEAALSCAYHLIDPVDAEVEVPPFFTLMIATPRLLIGRFNDTPMPALSVVKRATLKEIGVLWNCVQGREAYYPIYMDRTPRGRSTGDAHLGQGLGTEAKFAMLVHAFSGNRIDTLYARIHPTYPASLRLHRNLGFIEVPRMSVPYFVRQVRTLPSEEMIYFKLSAQDFTAWNAQRDKSPEALASFFDPSTRLRKRSSFEILDVAKFKNHLGQFVEKLRRSLAQNPEFAPTLEALDNQNLAAATAKLEVEAQKTRAILETLRANRDRETSQATHYQAVAQAGAPAVRLQYLFIVRQLLDNWDVHRTVETWKMLKRVAAGEGPGPESLSLVTFKQLCRDLKREVFDGLLTETQETYRVVTDAELQQLAAAEAAAQ